MDLIAIGRVRTAFGLTGEVRVESFSGETEHFAGLGEVRLEIANRKARYTVEGTRVDGTSLLMKLEGVDAPETAKRLAGAVIWCERSHAAPLAADEYYAADLVGCALVHDGESLGTVVGTWESGVSHMLEVRCRDGSVKHVPFMSPYIGDVDVERKRIALLTEWILG